MAAAIDYYLSLQSPWTWLGHNRLYDIAAKYCLEVNCRVVDFGEIFARSGGLPLGKRAPQRQAYRLLELERWRKKLDVPLNIHPAHFPVAEALAAHVVMAAGLAGADAGKLSGMILRAVWMEEKDVGDEATLRSILVEAGLEADEVFAAVGDQKTEEAWKLNTQLAIDAGVFGAPTYIFEGELFWGQDRLDFLEDKISSSHPQA